MTDLLERTTVQDELLDERKPEPKVEPPPREKRGIERPTAKRPVRWIRWMIGALVLIVAATVVTFALSGDGTTEVLDTDGSFQANETQRMEALAPATDSDMAPRLAVVDPSLGPNQDLAPDWVIERSAAGVIDVDGSFQANEARRMAAENVAESTDTYTPLDPYQEVKKAKEAMAAESGYTPVDPYRELEIARADQ